MDFRKDRNTDRPVWDSLTDDSSDYRQNVQFFGGNGVITGFVPGIWNGFLHRTITSIMMSCTETIFYTMSVYFLAAKVRKTRWTLAGALVSTAAGIAASVFLARLMS